MEQLLHQLLRLSAFVIESGGEISRVEEGLSRMTVAYGAEESHVYATTSQVSVTVVKDGEVRTQMCRPHRVSLDLDRTPRLNYRGNDWNLEKLFFCYKSNHSGIGCGNNENVAYSDMI